MTLHDLTSQCYGGNISSGSASNKSGVVFKTDKTRVGLLIESKTTNDMDYDHSQSRFRLTEVQQAEYVSPLKQWFRKQNPLEQQAELEKDNMEHRPSRAVRYLNQRVFAVGETELAATKVEEKSVLEGAKIFGSSFLSGLVFMSFLSTPIGCLAHSLKGANMNSRTLFPDMVAAGLKTGLRSGVSYGALLATFRGANYALSGQYFPVYCEVSFLAPIPLFHMCARLL